MFDPRVPTSGYRRGRDTGVVDYDPDYVSPMSVFTRLTHLYLLNLFLTIFVYLTFNTKNFRDIKETTLLFRILECSYFVGLIVSSLG